jgi:hypothetical protein
MSEQPWIDDWPMFEEDLQQISGSGRYRGGTIAIGAEIQSRASEGR